MFSARARDVRHGTAVSMIARAPFVCLIALVGFQTGCVGRIGDRQDGNHEPGTGVIPPFAGRGYPGTAGSGFAGSGTPPFITAGNGGTVNNPPPIGGSSSPSAGRGGPQAGKSGATAGSGGSPNQNPPTADNGMWSPLSTLMIVNPMDYGAKGDGTSDDLPAMKAAVNALPAAGGVVFFPSGKSFKKSDLLTLTKSHVKLWAINRGAEIFAAVNGVRRKQAILCRANQGCGVFGLKLRSDATTRFDALEDNQISNDQGSLMEVVGTEVQGSAAVGIFLSGSKEHYIEGNYVHHTWADHIHHTSGAQTSWVWGNYIFNEAPSKGDDGVACVTYGATSTRCADMEWWGNTILHTDWGRGYSVIGGNNISIHDNWAIGVAGAGVIVASETSYSTSASQGITISNNYIEGCGHAIGHPGILVSGQSSDAGPLRDIALTKNVSIPTPSGAYRAEGMYVNVTNTGLATAMSALPSPVPAVASVHMADTTILRTRDVSHVAANVRPGLYRIHIRRAASGTGFEQRFEYVVKGAESAVTSFTQARGAAGDRVSEQQTVDGMAYALVLCASPITIPSDLSAVAFRDMRDGDQSGKLSWLWKRVDSGNY